MKETKNVIEDYKKLTKGFTPSVDEYKEVVVEMFPKNEKQVDVICGTLGDWAEMEYAAIEIAMDSAARTFSACTEEEFKAYCMYLIDQRVKYVNGEKVDYTPYDETLHFPALISVICQNIGTVVDDRTDMILKPKMSDAAKELIKEKEMDAKKALKISLALASIPGYQYAKGYVKNKTGSVEFMTMQVVEGVIKSYRHDTHPVYALLADIVGLKALDTAITPILKYGESQYIKSSVLYELTSV